MIFIFKDGKFKVDITDKVKEIPEDFPIKFKDDNNKRIMTPAGHIMFEESMSKYLDSKKRELFHRVVVQNSFISKCSRQDIQPIIAGLFT